MSNDIPESIGGEALESHQAPVDPIPSDVEIVETIAAVIHEINATLQVPVYETVIKEAARKLNHPIFFIRDRIKTIEQTFKDARKMSKDSNQELSDWIKMLGAGLATTAKVESDITDSGLDKASRRGNADYRQFIADGGDKLWAGRPKFGSSDSDQRISGDKALFKIMGALGLGSTIQIPLWHSGVWITLKAPSSSSLLVLGKQIENEKAVLGASTSGSVFSNRTVYIAKYLLDFIFNHIIETTVKDFNEFTKESFYNLIKITDIPTLAWGMACTIYPSGYPFKQPCVAGQDVCTHITEMMINLAKISWTDNSRVTLEMRKHMANRIAKKSVDEIQKYQIYTDDTESVELRQSISVVFKVPNIMEFLDGGYRWIDECTQLIDKALTSDLSEEQRAEAISESADLTTLRQYASWVSKIFIGDEYIEDRDTLETTISELTADIASAEKFFSSISEYIGKSTISIIAVPKTSCPVCGTPTDGSGKNEQGEYEPNPKHPRLCPIDAVSVFFTLLIQRLSLPMAAALR